MTIELHRRAEVKSRGTFKSDLINFKLKCRIETYHTISNQRISKSHI